MTFYVPVSKLLFKKNVVAGANYLQIGHFVFLLRSSTNDLAPITVKREGKYWRIMDGRHRVLAHIIAGRNKVLAKEEL